MGSMAGLDESMQVHARTKLKKNYLFPNQDSKEYDPCVWRNNRMWRPWRIKRKHHASNMFVRCASPDIQLADLHVLENRKRRSMHAHVADMFSNEPTVYV